jgi:rhodanese-related sulfurtransferase
MWKISKSKANRIMVQQIAVKQLADRLAAGQAVCLLDVRQPWEHETAALPDSCLIPLNELMGRTDEIQPAADALVVVYCHHGIRSLSGAAILERLGFGNVVSLAGGIDAWSLHVDPKVPRY